MIPRPTRRLFLLLWILAMIGIVAILPYIVQLLGNALRAAPVPLPTILLLQEVQGGVLAAIAVAAGLWLSRRAGLTVPVLTAYAETGVLAFDKRRSWQSALWGIGVGVVIAALSVLFARMGTSVLATQNAAPSVWAGLLASVYGGIDEEIFLRLFLMSLIVWIVRKLVGARGAAAPLEAWTGIVLASILFGMGHLPAAAALGPLTPWSVAQILLLNGIGGLVFGWLYWRHGLEYAMIAHFSTDIVIHVLMPLVG